MIEGDKDASGESSLEGPLIAGKGRLAYLVAFSSLLPLIPAALCLSDLERVSVPLHLRCSAYPQLLPILLRSLSLPHPAQRANTITTLSSILETANHSATIDTILHTNALAMVEAILKSAIRDPSTETSGVSVSPFALDGADI